MNSQPHVQERINFQADLAILLKRICHDYQLGNYQSFSFIAIGIEDCNLILTTDRKKVFVKIFNASRNRKACLRYISIIAKIIGAGVKHPQLLQSVQGELYQFTDGNTTDYLCVTEYVEGKSFFESGVAPTKHETQAIIRNTAIINSFALHPAFIYDSWAITNFLQEYQEKSAALQAEDLALIAPLVKQFAKLSVDQLPHCFVHGDLITTNVIKDTNGTIFITDFAVANYYPRIQELAVLLCDLLLGQEQFVLSEYQKIIQLTAKEKEVLPLYITFAHAMHLLRANYEKVVNKNYSTENEYFLTRGRNGLRNPLTTV